MKQTTDKSFSSPSQHGYLLLTADFPPIEGGISTLAIQIARGLHQHCSVIVGAPDVSDESIPDDAYPYPVFRIPGYDWGIFRAVRAKKPVERWLRENPGKVGRIIAMNVGFGGWLGKTLRNSCHIPFDVLAYGYEFLKYRRNPVMRRLLLGIYQSADRILSISDFTTGELIQFGAPQEKIRRIHLGVDTVRFHPGRDSGRIRQALNAKEKRVLLSVGRLIARKGHHLVIRSLQRVAREHPQVEYWILGRGPARVELENLVQQLNLSQFVRFLGYVPDSDLPDYYAASDLHVLPATQIQGSVEGYGLVFLEAAACGIPSVACCSGGVPEAVLHNQTGILLDRPDVDALTNVLIDLLHDPQKLLSLGNAARIHAESRSLEKMITVFL